MIQEKYNLWKKYATQDKDLIVELNNIEGDNKLIEDAFYRDLEFGTGGLRGVIGAGTNRMNVYTVAKASQGLANYINKNYNGKKSIAVSYDSRIKSDLFAKVSAEVFAANDIEVHIYPCLMPTPCLSYAVRKLGCNAGIMITASHNPKEYNGYKVYNETGGQILDKEADDILKMIENVDIFGDVKSISLDEALNGCCSYVDESVYEKYISVIDENTRISSLSELILVFSSIVVIYSSYTDWSTYEQQPLRASSKETFLTSPKISTFSIIFKMSSASLSRI